jgi:signal transduction histidine kinase
VFERFYKADQSRTSDESSGSGLGLALVHRIVSLHGAQVAVTSPGLGQGTTFVVRFPN